MMNEELRPDLGEEEGGGETCHDPMRLPGAAVLGPLLGLEHGLHQAIHDLLAGKHQLLWRLLHDLRGVGLVLLGREKSLQQLLKPLETGLATADHHVGDVLRLGDQQVLVVLGAAAVADRGEPHVLEDLHHELPDALLVVDPADHLDAYGGDPGVVRELQADVLQDLDHALAHTHPRVHDPLGKHVVVFVYELGSVKDELADQVDGRFADHSGGVEEAVVDALLHVVPAEDGGVLVDN